MTSFQFAQPAPGCPVPLTEEERHCPGCDDFWPVSNEFWEKCPSRLDGLMRFCKACNIERREGQITQLLPDVASKPCHACNTNKPLSAVFWYRNKGKKDGFSTQCKLCINAHKAERRRNGNVIQPRKVKRAYRSSKALAKRCGSCKKNKLLTKEFWYASKAHGDGFMTICKVCDSAAQKARLKRIKESKQALSEGSSACRN